MYKSTELHVHCTTYTGNSFLLRQFLMDKGCLFVVSNFAFYILFLYSMLLALFYLLSRPQLHIFLLVLRSFKVWTDNLFRRHCVDRARLRSLIFLSPRIIPAEQALIVKTTLNCSGDPPQYFFDRNPEGFLGVLQMFRCGVIYKITVKSLLVKRKKGNSRSGN